MTSYFFLCVLLLSGVGFAQDATTVHQQIAKQLASASTLKLDVVASSGMAGKVSISAKRGNKFILDMPDRTIICDGKNVWNYTKEKKSVVISAFNAASGGISVEKIMLDVIAKYKATSLTNQGKGKNALWMLNLQPNGETLYGIRSITLGLDDSKKIIRRISISSDQGSQEWTVKSLQINPKLSDAAFSYSAPKGVEVIDMRE